MRCVKCGSRKVSLVKNNEGYSFSKGIVGTAVLGPVGAVAGINGKTSQVYHCNECGTDEIIAMPEVIEGFINEAIQRNDVFSLKDYKKQYPGIEWTDSSSVTPIAYSLGGVTGSDMGHSKRVELFQSLKNAPNSSAKKLYVGLKMGVLIAEECGSPNLTSFNFSSDDESYIKQWYRENAEKMNISKNAWYSLGGDDDKYGGPLSYGRIENSINHFKEQALKMKNDPSAYLSTIGEEELIAKIKQILRQNQLPQTMKDICDALNLFESTSYYYPVKYSRVEQALGKMVLDGDIRWKTIGEDTYACLPKDVDEMTDWKAEGSARKYDYSPFISEVCDYIAGTEGCSEDDIAQFIEKQHPELITKNKYLPSAIAHNCLNELLRKKSVLVIDNRFAPVIKENIHIALRDNSTASEDYVQSIEKEIYTIIIDMLKAKEEGVSASAIITSLNEEYDEQVIYDQLICAEYFGDARKEGDDVEIWYFVDAYADEKEKLQKQLTELADKTTEIQKAIEKYEAGKETRIQEAMNEPFDESDYNSKINELQNRIDENSRILPTLGFFKKKEKERLQWQITNDKKEIEKLKEDCASEKKRRIDSKVLLVQQEGDSLYKTLKDLEAEQVKIKEQVSAFENASAGIEEKNQAIMEKYSSLSSDEKAVFDVLKRTGKSTAPALLKEEELSWFSNQRITHMLTNLVKGGFVAKEYVDRIAYYETLI